jgi:tRNA(adenine34) deaminase
VLDGATLDRYAAWMTRPLELAAAAERARDVPVGAVVVDADGVVVGEGYNVREAAQDPTGHAELVAIRSAARALGSWRLLGCTLVVTLEPCVMCAGAMVMARVPVCVFGAWDPKAGACGSVWDVARDPRANHRVEIVGGVRSEECGRLLLDFFAARRLR